MQRESQGTAPSGCEALFLHAQPLAIRAAQVRARRAVASGEVPWFDGEDLQQEGLLAWWRKLPQFDPNRAGLRRYVELVISSRLASVRRARRRRPRLQPLDEDHEYVGDGWARRIELRTDVRRVLATLQDSDRRLAVVLMTHTSTEASRLLGIARSTVYARIRRIRVVFVDAGLGPQRAPRP
jgi:RNA polymerase sigma factor (sigma-70 family)